VIRHRCLGPQHVLGGSQIARARVCWTPWRPAAYRSVRPRLVRSCLSLPGPNPHRDGRIRTAPALSGSPGWPSGAWSSVRPHLPQASPDRAVVLDSAPAAAPAHALPARRRQPLDGIGTSNAKGGGTAFSRPRRPYPAHGARHRNKKTAELCPDWPRRRG
jgi:hypothetical protein